MTTTTTCPKCGKMNDGTDFEECYFCGYNKSMNRRLMSTQNTSDFDLDTALHTFAQDVTDREGMVSDIESHNFITASEQIKAFILAAEERGRLALIEEIRKGLPPKDETPDADEIETADRRAWNAYRTQVIALLDTLMKK